MVAAGDVVRASDNFTDWTTFTPTLLNFNVGAGSKTGAWRRNGPKTIDLIIYATLGSGFSITGGIGFTLPGGLSADGTTTYQMVPALMTDISATGGYTGYCTMQSGGGTNFDTILGPGVVGGAATVAWASTVPVTWASSDRLTIQGTIRVTT